MMQSYAVDASCILNPNATGIGCYTRNLVVALEQLYRTEQQQRELVLVYRAGHWRNRGLLPKGAHLCPQIWHKNLYPRWPRYASVLCPELRMPHWPGVGRVGVIHDLHAVLGLNCSDQRLRQRSIAQMRDYVTEADQLIFVSRHVSEEFFAHFDFPRERGHVIHHGVGPEFRPHSKDETAALRARHGLQRPYFLWTGMPRPSKNLERLLQAFAAADGVKDHDLVICGDHCEGRRIELEGSIARLGLSARVHLPGYLPHAEMPPLFAAARAYLFPSLHEGFGIPILEAMASGTPVLTSNSSACPEAAGGHALLVDPGSVDDIAGGIEAAAAMSAERIAAARAYAATKTWTETARKTLGVLEQAVAVAAPARRPGAASASLV